MTDDEKEMVATIKLSLLRAIVDLNEETIAMAIKAPKSEEPSEDCVSRQAVLESINDWWGITSTSGEPTLCDCIRELPPVTPTRKKAQWRKHYTAFVNDDNQIVTECHCTNCYGIAYFRSMGEKLVGANYCPNCGAEMENEE